MQTALMKSYRHWARITRSGTPSAYVRRVLVTTHTSWRRRLSSTEQVMETLPDRADPYAGPGGARRGAAAGAAGTSPADADGRRAAVLRRPLGAGDGRPHGLHGEHGQHPHRPRPGSPSADARQLPGDRPCHRQSTAGGAVVMEETELRSRLEALAEREAPALQKPEELVSAVVSRSALRRQRWTVAAVITAVLLAVPAIRSWIEPDSRPASPDGASYDVYGQPTRGSLADNTGVVDAVGRLPWAFDGAASSTAPRQRTGTSSGSRTSPTAGGRWWPDPIPLRPPTAVSLAPWPWPGSKGARTTASRECGYAASATAWTRSCRRHSWTARAARSSSSGTRRTTSRSPTGRRSRPTATSPGTTGRFPRGRAWRSSSSTPTRRSICRCATAWCALGSGSPAYRTATAFRTRGPPTSRWTGCGPLRRRHRATPPPLSRSGTSWPAPA